MRYVRCCGPDGHAFYGILRPEDRVEVLDGPYWAGGAPTGTVLPLAGLRLLAPCQPGKIVGIGANYRSQLQSRKAPWPERPRIFLKPSTSVIGPGDAIVCPDPAHVIHFEGELAVVIGARCRCVPEERALEHVLGYTCLNDVTDRTMLEEDGIWTRGKGADTFAPLGPVVTDEIDAADSLLQTTVNGTVRQDMSTSDLYFPVPALIAFISRTMTLEPGDVIATGSPVGMGPFAPGDEVAVSIAGIGTLRNTMRLPEVAHED